MKVKIRRLVMVFFVALGVFGFGFVVVNPFGVPDSPPAGAFEKAGYLVLVPYVDNQLPGFFFTVEQLTERSVSLHQTCNIPNSEIEPLIHKTKTVDEEIYQKLRMGYRADLNVLTENSSVDLDSVQMVHVRYENSAVWFITAQSLYDIRDKYLQGNCANTIEKELRKGLEVCQTKKVIFSDVIFEVTYESGFTTKVKAPGESFEAEGSASREEARGIEGKKMFHAVKLDEGCLRLNLEQAAAT